MKALWTMLLVGVLCMNAYAQSTPAPESESEPATTQAVDTQDAEEPMTAESLAVELSGADFGVEVVGDSIVVTGLEEDIDTIEAFVQLLDEGIAPQDYRVITIKNRNAPEIAGVIEETMRAMIPREPRPGEEIRVRAISNNILLITGPAERLDVAANIVSQIDQVKSGLPDVDSVTYQLEHIKAAEAATKLEELIQALRERQGADPQNQIKITPIDASNSLFVLAPMAEHEKIRQLISQIDVEPKAGFGDLKLAYFPLLNSEASSMADVLNDLFSTTEGAEAAEETIRRIRMVKSIPGEDGELVELPPINLERQIRLIPDEDSQALICATAEENIEPLRELIDLLDGVPLAVEQGMKIYPLEYADSQSVADMLDDMFQQGKDLPKPAPGSESTEAVPVNELGEALVYNVGLSADIRTNTLVATGRPEQLALITTIVERLDVPATELKHPLRLIHLDNTDATRIGSVIEELFDKRIEGLEEREAGKSAIARERVFLAIDIRSNSLIVSATEENYDEIVSIAQQLDTVADPLIDQIRIINCENTSAADLQSKIEELWERKASLRREGEVPEDLPVIVADQRSNALVIASSPEDFEEIKRLVDRLESQPLAPIAEIRLVELKNNDASQIADMLQSLFEERLQQRLAQGQEENPSDRVAVAAEPATNTILIASSKENYDEMARIIEAIDIEPDLEGIVQVFTLQNAQAENVAERITDLFDQGLYTGIVSSDNQVAEERQKVALVAEPRSNAIIASASKTNLGIIAKLIENMDTSDAPMLNADTRVFQLDFADALRIAGMLDQLFEGMESGSDGDFTAPTIVAEPTTNTLIITGSRDGIKRATDLIATLDRETDRSSLIRVYNLEFASAGKIAAKLQEIFDQRSEGADAERTPVYLLPDEPTNTVIAAAAEEDQAMVKHLLGLLDVPSTISRQVQVFPLKFGKAEPIAETLDNLFEAQSGAGGADVGRADAIAVRPDRRTNALVVWASESEMENIATIINKLDAAEPAQELMVKVIPLKRALAEDLAESLTETLNQGQEQTGDDAEAVIVSFEETQPDGSVVVRKLLRQDIVINPDMRTNALFVMAPAGSMGMLENLIRSIDRIPPTVAEIRLYPLANADAEEVVEKLQELFEEQSQQEGPETQLQIGQGGVAMASGGPGGEGSIPGQMLRFTADQRTNTVIAAGSETDLNMVERLVRHLDAQDVEDRIQQVYEPRYIPAADLSTAVSDFFEEENDLFSELDDAQSIRRQAERHVTVVGDEDSNTLLLGMSPRNFTRTMEMLYSIDRPPPQVSVQVLIAEVALDDSLEFGMEFALQDLLFSETAVVGPNGVVQSNEFDFVGGTDVGAAGASGSFGGFTFSITGEDFNFLLRALQSDGSLEVLSRPQITVENNEEANITIGDEVPFLRSSNVSDSGQVNSSVEYEEVGIILTVKPHINPDGYVNLEVSPEISSLNSGSSVQISEGLTAPTFSKRSAETVVTVKDGETIVIGGLIQTTEDYRETKVPIFGDLPVLGNLFRAMTNSRRRTELLIVLTVNVLWDEHDSYVESVKLRDQSGFLPEKMKRSPLMGGLRIQPGDQVEAYPVEGARLDRPTTPDRPLYGPQPEIYGPIVPQRDPPPAEEGSAFETFGPPPPGAAVEPVAMNIAD